MMSALRMRRFSSRVSLSDPVASYYQKTFNRKKRRLSRGNDLRDCRSRGPAERGRAGRHPGLGMTRLNAKDSEDEERH